jgi:hypothetical protein
MRTSENKIIIKPETDLGVWFGIDGKAIKNQPQLDLAVIALAGVYGFKVARHRDLARVHKFIHNLENENEELDFEFENLLIASAEVCVKFLNSILPTGYQFTFTGEEYDTLELVKS